MWITASPREVQKYTRLPIVNGMPPSPNRVLMSWRVRPVTGERHATWAVGWADLGELGVAVRVVR